MALDRVSRVIAVLGPTNTGKTHYAIERMLGHRTGVFGLPLRLLAREVYDKVVALRGPSVVALVTGEERIVPARAAYWVCTVEAMPVDLGADFLAVDEIQLCADPDRGHIFTDRLLNARGLHETLFLGSDTMRGRIAALIPQASFLRRERYSRLTYTGVRKISRMPPRSAIVGFSVEDVYAIAELIRRQKGGAAVVMGALSPRTRNAQVDLYQNGDVDHLVATDAIGMGLNLDIAHVAFSGLVKFDGRRHRHLAPNELAQIAGRAGRYTTEGTFGATGDSGALEAEVADAIENHRFAPVRKLQWRNGRLDFGTAEALIRSLEAMPDHPDLVRVRESDDLLTLRTLHDLPAMRDRVRGAQDVRLLWDVCQIPDFRKVSPAEHASLCVRLYQFLHDGGCIPTDWLARQIERIDRTEGDLDALSKRLAFIRTWTYVAQRRGWVDDADHWRDETRAVEDRLSDALHARLTQRFVDRRTSVLMRRLKQRENLVAQVTENGEVRIDDQFVGHLEGFRFRLDPAAAGQEAQTLRAAAFAALGQAFSLRADKLYNAPDPEIDVTEQGGLMWGELVVGRLVAGPDPLSPQVLPFVDEEAGPEVAEKVRRRLSHWIDRRIAALFEPLNALKVDETLTGMARGIAFRLVEALGILPRSEIADEVKALDQDQRAGLRKHGVRFGQYTVFLPTMLKPAPTRLRLVLWSLAEGFDEFPEAPPPGLVTIPARQGVPQGYYPRAGYRLAGERAIRIDMLERLADLVRGLDARAGFEATPDMLSITGLTLEQFTRLMEGMGYRAEQGTRPKVRPAPVVEAPKREDAAVAEPAPADGAAGETAVEAAAPVEQASETASGTAAEPVAAEEVPAEEVAAEEVPAEEVPAEEVAAEEVEGSTAGGEAPSAETAEDAVAEATEPAPAEVPVTEAELEVFYSFTRAPRQRPRHAGQPQRSAEPRGEGEERGGPRGRRGRDGKPGERPQGKPHGKAGAGKGKVDGKPAATARPPRPEKPIDPDNPFAALLALKQRS